MNYPVISEGCPSVFQQHSAAVVCAVLNHATPKPPPEDGASLKGPGDPAAVVSAARRRCHWCCLPSPQIQSLDRHTQRAFRLRSQSPQQDVKLPVSPGCHRHRTSHSPVRWLPPAADGADISHWSRHYFKKWLKCIALFQSPVSPGCQPKSTPAASASAIAIASCR
jgi:hypothetical protein